MQKLPLSKQITFGVIVAGTAFVVSFALAAITAGVPAEQHTTPTWFIGLIFGVVAGTVYLMLAGNRGVALADDVARERVLAGAGNGTAQLIVVRQGFVGKLAGVDVLIDGSVATQLKSPRFAALDLTPGRHEVVASVQGKSTPPEMIDLAPGETVVLRIDMAIGRAKLTREHDLAAIRRTLATVPMVTEFTGSRSELLPGGVR